MRYVLIAAVAATGMVSPAVAEGTKDPNMVCKRIEGDSGSNLRRWKRVCRTKAQWAGEAEETRRDVDRDMERAAGADAPEDAKKD